jgi:hypothetical protein
LFGANFFSAAQAFSQDTAEAPAAASDPLSILVEMFRWEGMLASIIVIVMAWIILRFADGLVDHLGNIFADRRLFIHKISAFFHFFVYIATMVVVVLFSFKIRKEILIILSGTGAVAIGGFLMMGLVGLFIGAVVVVVVVMMMMMMTYDLFIAWFDMQDSESTGKSYATGQT